MEYLYIFIVAVLFLLAISDLIVGVSNDAVNFVNSAVGSRAGTFRLIMVISGAGVLVGAVFSSGMMEIARKGLFHPDMFYFSEIMLIFLAVMMTDILLLDFFNSFGLPTSTTVSIVFEILGAAVAMSIIKIMATDDSLATIVNYINSEKAFAIIVGILLSVVIAFTVGALIQYITRYIFTFRYKKKLNYYAGVFGGLAVTAIVYFLLIKGFKDSAFMTKENYKFITENTFKIMTATFIASAVVMQLLHTLFSVNILRIIVLIGTFALAMAFAGNDLVNFIGVPIAGFKSYQIHMANPGIAPEALSMSPLAEPIATDIYLLIIAGLVMVLTLWLSKKAKTVIKTSIQLGQQDESGKERFGSSYFGRAIVQSVNSLSNTIKVIVPKKVRVNAARRFMPEPIDKNSKDRPAFDMLRAAVNTIVASILIAIGTSLKLPLSTTYVTFMVAMGTSLSDGAWGRDTAVYRVTGVLTVIGGWFFTAFIAFFAASIVLLIIFYGGLIGILGMIALLLVLIIRSNMIHTKREKESQEDNLSAKFTTVDSIAQNITKEGTLLLETTNKLYKDTFSALFDENRKSLKKLNKQVVQLNKATRRQKEFAYQISANLPDAMVEIGNVNIHVFENIREIAYCFNYITVPAYIHVNNVHKPLPAPQVSSMKNIITKIEQLYKITIAGISNHSINADAFRNIADETLELIEQYRLDQIKRMKNDNHNSRTNLLYLGFLHETNNIVMHMTNLVNTCEKNNELF